MIYTVGELRDQKMVQEIIVGLNAKGILAKSHFVSERDTYLIIIENEEQLSESQDFYRVKLGLQKPHKIDKEWIKIKSIPRGEYTSNILIICLVLYLFSFLNLGPGLYKILFMGNVESSFLEEVRRGQIWRLLTPIFLHMNFLHLLFNMLWFKDLGSLIEKSFGKFFLLKFILISGIISNLLQYFVSGPEFGGMSGVLYAMLGFIWAYKRLNPNFEYALPRFDIGMMIGWFLLCLTGLLGPIANSAHGGGLVVGILFAAMLNFKWNKGHLGFFLLGIFFLAFTLLIEGYKLQGRFYFLLSMS